MTGDVCYQAQNKLTYIGGLQTPVEFLAKSQFARALEKSPRRPEEQTTSKEIAPAGSCRPTHSQTHKVMSCLHSPSYSRETLLKRRQSVETPEGPSIKRGAKPAPE